MNPMPKTDAYELEILSAFEEGRLKSVATKAELAKFKATATINSTIPVGRGFTRAVEDAG
jgi:hypothetical protein